MVYKGISQEDVYEYVLEGERDSDEEIKTVWGIRPQGVAGGNISLARVVKAHGRRNIDDAAAETTKANRSEFLRMLAYVRNYQFAGTSEVVGLVEGEEDLLRIFRELDITTFLELSQAAKDVFRLRSGEKNGSSSSSGPPSPAKTQAGDATIAGGARS